MIIMARINVEREDGSEWSVEPVGPVHVVSNPHATTIHAEIPPEDWDELDEDDVSRTGSKKVFQAGNKRVAFFSRGSEGDQA